MVVMVGQSLLNIGVATGVLPTTGLPLPFFSYGGSSMLASLLLSGLLIRVARESSEADVVSLDASVESRESRSCDRTTAIHKWSDLSIVNKPGFWQKSG